MTYLNNASVSESEEKILEELSDGQWHPMNKINKSLLVKKKSRKDGLTQEEINESLASLLEKEIILFGSKDSYRLPDTFLKQWRTKIHGDSGAKDKPSTKELRKPRYFGGILEDEGWAYAPIKFCDLIHFRANGIVDSKSVKEFLDADSSVTQDEHGLIRIKTLPGNGQKIYDFVKEMGKNDPSLGISGVRLDSNAKRRNLEELPGRYLDELAEFYGSFGKILLRKNMSSISKHLKDRDDQQQQIYIWVVEAIQKYDEKTCIPFAAYLSESLNRWVHNLTRQAFGRAVADSELKHSRAISSYETEHGATPTLSELSELLNEPLEKVKKDSISIASVASLRSTITLDSDDFEIPLASPESTTLAIDEEIEKSMLSAAITSSALSDTGKPNVLGWLGVYERTWGHNKDFTKISKSVSTSTLNDREKEIAELTKERLQSAWN